jgi:tyrosyl-tRNA synthetase
MHILDTLQSRGLIQDISDEAGIRNLPPKTPFYVGFDPTAPSLQIGNLIPLLVALHLGRAGFTPIILFGGATGTIGDPSGKSQERQLLTHDTIEKNVAHQSEQVRTLFARLNLTVSFVNNFDWTKDISILDFLRDTGKHFTVNYMIAKEVVKTRLEGAGISFTEFSYMLLQAYDFCHLYQNKGCKIQIGGSDQWGNITAGLELIRKRLQGEAYGFSWPLLTNAQGKKFGKSESGTLWLDPTMTSPYTFHQFWLNTEDADVIRLLKIFTFLSEGEIQGIEQEMQKAPEKRPAQKLLADTICTLVHGEEATLDAKRSAQVLFGGSLEGLSEEKLVEIFKDVPSKTLTKGEVAGATAIDLFVASGALSSKGEARRLITSGGAYINNERVTGETLPLGENPAMQEALSKNVLVLRTGKKSYTLVKLTS